MLYLKFLLNVVILVSTSVSLLASPEGGTKTSPWLQDQLFNYQNVTGQCVGQKCKFSELNIRPRGEMQADVMSDNHRPFRVSTVSPQQANEAFNFIKNQTHIPLKDSRDSCWAKANEITWLLLDKGITTGFVYLSGKLHSDLVVKNVNQIVNWRYHVAPFILVHENGILKVKVIDPTVFDRPLDVAVWSESFLLYESSEFKKLWYVDWQTKYVGGETPGSIERVNYVPALRLINERELKLRLKLQSELFDDANETQAPMAN